MNLRIFFLISVLAGFSILTLNLMVGETPKYVSFKHWSMDKSKLETKESLLSDTIEQSVETQNAAVKK